MRVKLNPSLSVKVPDESETVFDILQKEVDDCNDKIEELTKQRNSVVQYINTHGMDISLFKKKLLKLNAAISSLTIDVILVERELAQRNSEE